MEHNSDILRVSCSNCRARFKINNPRSGVRFNCTRCGSPIVTPGEKSEEHDEKDEPNIVKIELHQSPFSRGEHHENDILPATGKIEKNRDEKLSESGVTKINMEGKTLKGDALGTASKALNTKKIFASDIQNRMRLLYLISLYTSPPPPGQKGTWIRKLPLQVFMFEGVINEVFDWDYAPNSIMIAEGRIIVNISQEGEYDLFALLMGSYVHNLKLTTTQHLNITAYQITPKGTKYVYLISESDKARVDELINCPMCGKHLNIEKRQESFYFVCKNDCVYQKRSSITDAEDVSYFCIPYFPETLSNFGYQLPYGLQRRLTSYMNSEPRDNIKDMLEELLYLTKVKVLIGEWLPFGSNQMAALNYKLGSDERVQSAKFTQELDTSPEGTTLEIPESLTLVKVRDYRLASYVNFEAICHLPEDPQIIQVEEFAVHIDFTGCVRYGLEIMAVNSREQGQVSLDHLPRILVDILQDSTTIMDTLLTNYQKNLLDIIFQGKSHYRDKYFFVVAEEIHCFDHSMQDVTAELTKILSEANYQNEINQITEEIKESAIFADGTVLIMGSHGSIFVTRTPEKYEQLIADFLFIMDIEIFLNNFFTRLFLMNDELNDIQKLIKNCEIDPNAIALVQQSLSRISGDAILMEELRCYLEEAVAIFQKNIIKRYGENCNIQEVVQTFQVEDRAHGLSIRIQDITKIIRGTQECMQGLTRVTDVISERQMRRIQETLSHNTRNLEEITKTNERSGMSLRILEVILAGGLAFNIMDQFTGEWMLSEKAILRPILQDMFDTPGIWLLLSVFLWLLFAGSIFLFMRWVERINSKLTTARIKMDIPCNIPALKKYLSKKNVSTYNADVFNICKVIKVHWEEKSDRKWLNNKPKIELVYDEKNGFLISGLIEVARPTVGTNVKRLQDIFMEELKENGIIDTAANLSM